ncbi:MULTISPECIES: citrate synthase family protein [Rhizobium]|uniref:Citrate synthase n=1 Tax=Rhizobium favelukesii TaxID=348824 RepID=W6RB59_9HYPH|nr:MULTISPECIES: citrate synthase family protein [Rhizobium]MCS0461958.1 citrate synthase family protein [Rhizobium favelukesii]UFS84257.1 citrate synthase family protein [Rhizobium sp. T136]CDM58074.1 citrate synthase [Rhizobium favelukesii]
MPWLSAEQALEKLGTKPQTLYANVSRGRIRAKPDATDPRRRLYSAADVMRLAERHAGRRKTETVAADTMQWGDPVLPSAISAILDGRLYYRDQDAATWAEHATLEETAALLWNSGQIAAAPGEALEAAPSLERAFVLLAQRVTHDLPTLGRSPKVLKAEAQSILSTVAAALAPDTTASPLHLRLAMSWCRPEAANCIRRALVLLADHELNASTFATRVAASSGATLSAAVLSGLSTLTGPLHGGAWQGVASLIEDVDALGAGATIRQALTQGRSLPAFGHPLYPDGDIRAKALMSQFALPPSYAKLAAVGQEIIGESVNIDFALTAMTAVFNLPDNAPLVIFALARTVGWLAHAMEQVESGHLIRPRARYTGPAIETPLKA